MGTKQTTPPSNLRGATKSQNRWNSKVNTDTISGVKGVYADNGRWKALLTYKGVRYYLGMFNSVEEAKEVVEHKYAELQGEFMYKGET